MHIQRQQMNDICRRAHAFDLAVAIGGPSVSACPDYYPVVRLSPCRRTRRRHRRADRAAGATTVAPAQQVVLTTNDRVAMSDFPVPAYELAEIKRYLLGSIQYSSGCPYQCEFCDIPGLYGRNPRLKTPQQIIAELDKTARMRHHRHRLFRRRQFHRQPQGRARSAAASDRMAEDARLRHAARLRGDAQYRQAARDPGEDARGRLRHHLLRHRDARSRRAEGDAQGPQHDGPDPGRRRRPSTPTAWRWSPASSWGSTPTSRSTGDALLDFIEESKIPLLTINLLQALPKTPLWDRLARENRLIDDDGRDSNVEFLLPYDQVVSTWRECMEQAYEPAKLFARYQYQMRLHLCEPAEGAA